VDVLKVGKCQDTRESYEGVAWPNAQEGLYVCGCILDPLDGYSQPCVSDACATRTFNPWLCMCEVEHNIIDDTPITCDPSSEQYQPDIAGVTVGMDKNYFEAWPGSTGQRRHLMDNMPRKLQTDPVEGTCVLMGANNDRIGCVVAN